MLGKNNYKERLKRMEMQSKQDHFSIRKLSIGAASVLLGFTFFGLNSQTAKADTVDPKQEVSENVNTKSVQSSSISSDKKTETQDTQSDATKENDSKLSTYTGLTSFFKGTDKVTVKNADNKTVTETEHNKANSTSDEPTSSQDASTADHEKTDELITSDNQSVATSNQEQKVQTKVNASTAQVYNWDDFKKAFRDVNVSEIDIMNDIVSGTGGTEDGFNIPGRKLLITSGGNTRHIIDFEGCHPNLTGNDQLQITYRNLEIWSSDWYGIIKTDQYGYDATKNNTAIITLDDIDFHGSQMLYVRSHNEIHLKNKITAETINNNYTSPVNPKYQARGGGNTQQLFEFTNNDNNIYFDTGCTFTGTTYGGNVIQMSQGNGNIHVEQGATVTLNPLGNADGSLGNNPGETTGTTYGIYIAGSGKIDVEGVLNINVGKSKSNASQAIYNGTRNAVQAKAIGLNDANSSFNIGSGGSVNITTNGNISNNTNTSLIFDGGNFIINPNGSLKITGEDMGDYNGTLVAIASSADIENGTFEIRLKNGGSTNAGSGAITLIDATGNLTVNNPESLVLDAHLNKNPATSLIGNNQVTITNVRQKLNLSSIVPSLKDLTLPPYHLLKVKKDSNGNIQVAPNGIEVLNGQQVFDTATLQKIQDDKDLGPIFKNLPDNILSELKQLAGSGSATYDDVFSGIINYAFSDPSNIGYNDISFIPANPSGFLDINPANVKVSYNEDGTSTITGAILNYTDATDGVNSDGLFSKILPGGTNAYVRAYVKDSSGKETAIKPNSEIDDPYKQTADSGKTLSHDFTAMAKYNEKTGRYEFSFNIPVETTKALKKGDKIELYPNANFIEYNPLATKLPESDSNHRPIAVDVLAAAQDTAAQEINDELQKINNDQSIKHNKDLDDAIANAKQVAAKSDSSNYDSGKSVYGADNIPEVEKRKKDALSDLQTAYETAQKESQALSDQVKASKTAITNAAKEAENRVRSTSLTNDEQQTYIDAIEKAKDEALATKDDANFDPAKSIYGSDNVDDVKNKETKATNIFNKEAAKGELDGFAKDCETTLGLDSTNNKGVEDAKTAAITAIDNISDSAVSASDNTTEVNNSENDGKTNILDAVKAAAKDQLSNSNTSVQGAIDKIDGLSTEEKKAYKAQADALITNDKKAGYADLIDQDSTAADIKGHLTGGIAALNELEVKAQDAATRNKAISRIKDAATNAKAQIDQNNDLTAAQKTKYEGDISTLVSEGTQAVKNAKSADIDTTAQEYIDQINNVPKTAGSDLLDAQRDTAKQAVEAAAKKASDAISAISDDLLDPATKTKYNKQITDAENAATSAIDAATTADAITSEQTKGINDINDIYQDALLAKEKASALTDLAAAKDKDLGLIDADLKDGSIDDETAQNAKANINSIYTQAVVKITTKDNDIETVDADKNKAIDDMDKIAENIKGSQEEQDVRKAKKTAIDELAGLADKVKTEIAADKNLSQVEKDGYTDQVDQALANAKNKINAATTTDEVTKNENAGKADITQVENDASLQSAKDLGLADIQKAKKDALDQVKKLTNVDDDTKNQLNSEINDAYDAAKDKIESPDPATADQVNKNAQEGVTNINNVVSDLNVAKAANKRKLAKYAEKAIDRIDANTDLTADDKTKIEQAINDARDKGITNIDAVTTTVADVEAAEKEAEENIDVAATAGDNLLNTQRNTAKQAIEDAATKAKNAIENNKFLDADSKTKYEDKIEAAQKAAETAIDAATTANAITSAQNTGINNISDVSLAAEKASALTELVTAKNNDLETVNAAHDNGSVDDSNWKDAVNEINSIYDAAVKKITNDDDITTIGTDKTKAIDDMDKIAENINGGQAEQDLRKAKKNAIDDLTESADKVKTEIANDKNLSQVEKDGYTDRVDQALADAKNKINAATTTDEVTKNENAGKADITQVENDASLQSAKDLGLADIQKAKKDALDQVKKLTNVDDDTKNQLNSEINDAYDAAKDKIESPDPATADQVNKNAQEGVTNINNVVSDLNVAKAANKRKLAKYAEKAIDRIDANTDLTADDKTKIEQAINDARDKGITNIDAVTTTVADVEAAEKEAEENIDVAATAGDNLLNTQRNTAKQAIEDAATKAKNAIENNKFLDADSKTKYEDKIEAAQKAAETAIDTATTATAITSEQTKGINDINDIYQDASLAAEKASALTELAAAKNKDLDTVNAAHDKGSVDDPNWKDAVNDINSIYDAAVKKITNDDDVTTVGTDKNDAISAMDKIANGIDGDQDAQDLRTAKNKAINELAGLADQVKNEIANDKNLTQLEKDGYTDRVDQALANAKNEINAATTTDEVTKNEAAGKADITKVENDASLQSAKDLGLADIQKAKKDALDQVKKLTNVDDDTKNQLNSEINDAYDAAKDKIESPDPATADQVNKNAQEGVTNINNVVSDLNVAKAANKRKLAKYAEKAIDRIDANTDLTADDKTKIEQAINDARDKGITDIDAATTSANVETAEKAAENAIDVAATVNLDTNKNSAKSALDTTAANAKTDLKNIYDKLTADYQKLTDDQKATAKADYDKATQAYEDATKDGGTIDQACAAAKANVDSAKNKDELNKVITDGNSSILNKESTASLAIIKAQAKQDIQKAVDEAKAELKDKNNEINLSDQSALDEVQKLGNSDIDAETNAETVSTIRDNTIKGINNIVTNAKATNADQIRKDRDDAIKELDKVLKGDKDAGISGVLDKIDALEDDTGKTGLTADEITKFKEQAQKAHDEAVAAISGATDDQINDLKQKGIDAINQALIDAQIQAAKRKGNSDLDTAAKEAKDKIAQSNNLTDTEKAEANQAIDDATTTAKKDVDAATSVDEVNKAVSDGKDAINDAVTKANSAKDLTSKKKDAKDAIDAEAAVIKKRINSDANLSRSERLSQSANVDLEAGKAKNAIDRADNVADVIKQRDTGVNAIDAQYVSGKPLADQKTDAIKEITSVATEAANKVDKDDSKSANEKDKEKKAIADAAAETKDAINRAKGAEGVNKAKVDGIAKIEAAQKPVITLADQKKTAKDAIDDAANKAKNKISQDPGLTNDEKATANKEIDSLADDAKNNIDQATNIDEVEKAEAEGTANITQVQSKVNIQKKKDRAKKIINDEGIDAKKDIDRASVSDSEKQAAKAKVDQAVKDEQAKVDKANDGDEILDIIDESQEIIHSFVPDSNSSGSNGSGSNGSDSNGSGSNGSGSNGSGSNGSGSNGSGSNGSGSNGSGSNGSGSNGSGSNGSDSNGSGSNGSGSNGSGSNGSGSNGSGSNGSGSNGSGSNGSGSNGSGSNGSGSNGSGSNGSGSNGSGSNGSGSNGSGSNGSGSNGSGSNGSGSNGSGSNGSGSNGSGSNGSGSNGSGSNGSGSNGSGSNGSGSNGSGSNGSGSNGSGSNGSGSNGSGSNGSGSNGSGSNGSGSNGSGSNGSGSNGSGSNGSGSNGSGSNGSGSNGSGSNGSGSNGSGSNGSGSNGSGSNGSGSNGSGSNGSGSNGSGSNGSGSNGSGSNGSGSNGSGSNGSGSNGSGSNGSGSNGSGSNGSGSNGSGSNGSGSNGSGSNGSGSNGSGSNGSGSNGSGSNGSGSNGSGSNGSGSNGSGSNGSGSNGSDSNGSGSNGSGSNGSGSNGSESNGSDSNGSGSNGSGSNGSGSNGSGSNGSGSNGSGSNGSGSNGSDSNGSGSNGSDSNGSGSNGSGSNGSDSNGSGSNGSGSNGSGSNGSGSNGSGSNGSGSNGSGSNGSGSNGSGSNGSGSNGSDSNGSGSNGSGSNGSGSNGSGSNGSDSNGSGSSSTSGGNSSDSQGTGTAGNIAGNGDINSNNATNKNPGTSGSETGSSTENVDVDLNNSKEVKLMHNAYVYDIHGNRANQITLGAGSIIRFYGIKNIAGVDYYIVVDQGEDNEKLFVKVANAEAAKLKLKHNSYVYNKHGKRVKKDGVLKKGVLVNIYGGAVKIRGKKYYIIDSNRYIKAANVTVKSSSAKTSKAEVVPVNLPTNTNTQNIVEKDIIHNSYLYDDKGRRANKLIFLGGSIVNTTSQRMIDGKLYYELDDGLYIKVNNVDGKKSKLTHNAFIYSKHGNRIGKKVLKKNSLVKTYGAAIKINHKKFYLIDKDKYVKKANF